MFKSNIDTEHIIFNICDQFLKDLFLIILIRLVICFQDEKFSSSENEEWKHSFSFVQAADTQLGFINLLGDKDKVYTN